MKIKYFFRFTSPPSLTFRGGSFLERHDRNEEAKGNPFAFFMDKMRLEVIFLPIFEYKKNVHALLGEGGGEYVDRVS